MRRQRAGKRSSTHGAATAKPAATSQRAGDGRFRVIIAVNKPRFRSRSERAVAVPGWLVRSLTNREDPIGLLNRDGADIFVCSDTFGRSRSFAFLRAAQRFREGGLRIIAVLDSPDEMDASLELADAVFYPPWKAAEMRTAATDLYHSLRGEPAPASALADSEDDE